jgi:hypothetical protein
VYQARIATFARPDDTRGQLLVIEPQLRHLLLCAVALRAMRLQNRLDVARKIHFAGLAKIDGAHLPALQAERDRKEKNDDR